MRSVRESLDIDAPADRAWDLVASFEHWPSWGVSVSDVEAPEARVRPGLRGRVRTVVGLWLPFEITDVDPGRSWSWRVARIPATGHEVEPLGPDRCRVTFTVAWPVAPYRIVLRRSLRRLASLA